MDGRVDLAGVQSGVLSLTGHMRLEGVWETGNRLGNNLGNVG